MSFWNPSQPNEYSMRCKTGIVEELYTTNPETGTLDRIYAGGGGAGVEVPYWVKPNSAEIGAEWKKTIVTQDYIDVVDNVNSRSSSLTSENLTFGDLSGNSTLDKPLLDKVKTVTDRYTTNPWVDLPTWAKSTNASFAATVYKNTIDYLGSKMERTDTNSYSKLSYSDFQMLENLISVGRMSVMNNSNILVGYHTPGSLVQAAGKPFTRMEAGKITIVPDVILNEGGMYYSNSFNYNKDGVDYTFDLNVLKDVLKLYNKTLLATPTSNNKMVLYNPTTNDYNYSEIPSGGTSYPYLFSDKILMTSTDGKTITLDQNLGTISSVSSSGTSYIKINGSQANMEFKAGSFNKLFTWEDVKLTSELKHLVQAVNYIDRGSDKSYNVNVRYNTNSKTFNKEKTLSLILNATTDLVQLQDPTAGKPYEHPTTIFAGGTNMTVKVTDYFEKLLLTVNNLIYNRWYIIDLNDAGYDIITMEKTTLNSTAKTHDGELIFLKCQNNISGYTGAVGKLMFKVICPDIPGTTVSTTYTFLISKITNDRSTWPTATYTNV